MQKNITSLGTELKNEVNTEVLCTFDADTLGVITLGKLLFLVTDVSGLMKFLLNTFCRPLSARDIGPVGFTNPKLIIVSVKYKTNTITENIQILTEKYKKVKIL